MKIKPLAPDANVVTHFEMLLAEAGITDMRWKEVLAQEAYSVTDQRFQRFFLNNALRIYLFDLGKEKGLDSIRVRSGLDDRFQMDDWLMVIQEGVIPWIKDALNKS